VVIALAARVASGQHAGGDDPGRSAAVAALRSQPPAVLLERWTRAGHRDRELIADALAGGGRAVRAALRERAAHGPAAERRLSCELLGVMRDGAATDALLAAAADADPAVRRSALQALARIRPSQARAPVQALVTGGADPSTIKNALVVVGKIGTASDRALVRPYLGHQDAPLAITAAATLAMLGSNEGLALAIAGTDSADAEVRITAIRALGYFDDAAAGDRLAAILADPGATWRSHARVASAMRTNRTRVPAARVQELGRLAADPDGTVARWAIEELAADGSPEALQALEKVARTDERAGQAARRQLDALRGGAMP
jgi:HEAT repeat protein